MAATSTKPSALPSALKTPLSATYPSELRSPMVAPSPTWIKREREEDLKADLKTPITPPLAYMDFLKSLSPALMSPLPTGQSTRFSFPERTTSSSSVASSNASSASLTSATSACSSNPPASDPAAADKDIPGSPTTLSNSTSRASSCCNTEGAKSEPKTQIKQITIPPPSPYTNAGPMSSRSLRRLQIPQSPYSPGACRSPMSARSIQSPYSAAFSPREFDLEQKPGGPKRAVTVRQVVTRTVTYARTPVDATPPAQLDPAPKGKRRRIE